MVERNAKLVRFGNRLTALSQERRRCASPESLKKKGRICTLLIALACSDVIFCMNINITRACMKMNMLSV